MATATVVPIPSNKNSVVTIQSMLYSPEVTVNPGEILESSPIANDKPITIIRKNLSPQAISYIVKKKIEIEKEVKKLKIKNSISNSTLFDEILNDRETRSEKQKCSEILGFTLRELSPTESTKFGLDTTKTFYIIDGVSCGSVAEIIGFKVGDIIIGMYNSNNTVKQLFDYDDDEALYNSKGNTFNDRTILYINIRVFRYDKKLNAFSDAYITPLFEKYDDSDNVLYHGRRFIIPYLNNPDNTITRFGSLYFKNYIYGLTDFEQVGGGQAELLIYNQARAAAEASLQHSRGILQQCNADLAACRAFVDANPGNRNHPQFLRRCTQALLAINHNDRSVTLENRGISPLVQRANREFRKFTDKLRADARSSRDQTVSQAAATAAQGFARGIAALDAIIARKAVIVNNLIAPIQAAAAAQAAPVVPAQASPLAVPAQAAPLPAQAQLNPMLRQISLPPPSLLEDVDVDDQSYIPPPLTRNIESVPAAQIQRELASLPPPEEIGSQVSDAPDIPPPLRLNPPAASAAQIQRGLASLPPPEEIGSLISDAPDLPPPLTLGTRSAQAAQIQRGLASLPPPEEIGSLISDADENLPPALNRNIGSAPAAPIQRGIAASEAPLGAVGPLISDADENLPPPLTLGTGSAPAAPIRRGIVASEAPLGAVGPRLLAPVIIPGAIHRALPAPLIMPRLRVGLRLGILPLQTQDMSKQRILLINLYLNQIFNTILLNYKKKKINPALADLTIKSTYKYKDPAHIAHAFDFPIYPKIDATNDKKIISKINESLDQDKLISLTYCDDESASAAAAGGGRGFNYPLRRRKQKTIKKKIRNINNKNSLKHKIRNKINKCIKKCIKNNNIQKQKQEKQEENKNKYRIKKLLESKIHKKINKLKLNKTKNLSKNKSNRHKYTRKNY